MKEVTFFLAFLFILVLLPASSSGQTETKMEIARILLCEGIENREPVNESVDFSPDVSTIFCFTEIQNIGNPTTITHRWYHGDKLMANVPLIVEGDRFRTWSSKSIAPQTVGEWKVEIANEAEEILGEITFRVSAVEAPAEE
jgi:hypothetical protein